MIERIKKDMQEKIEQNTIKIPDVTWTDIDGKNHTEDVILKRSKLPLIGDWIRIYPPINEEGKVNWLNMIFGGKKNFIKLLIILGLLSMILFAFNQFFNEYEALKTICEPYLNLK